MARDIAAVMIGRHKCTRRPALTAATPAKCRSDQPLTGLFTVAIVLVNTAMKGDRTAYVMTGHVGKKSACSAPPAIIAVNYAKCRSDPARISRFIAMTVSAGWAKAPLDRASLKAAGKKIWAGSLKH